MKVDDVIAAIKEFFLEILGFLLPGLVLLLLCYSFLTHKIKLLIDNYMDDENSILLLSIVSYITGYVLFGISDAWRKNIKRNKPAWVFWMLRRFSLIEIKPYSDEISEKLKKSPDYLLALEIIHEQTGIKREDLENSEINLVRNLAMSYMPEVDRKIYDFMFRSELSDKINLALKIVFLFGAVSWVVQETTRFEWIFNTDNSFMLAYFSLIVIAYFLRRTQRRFYDIAMRIVFPIFVVKFKMIDQKKKNGTIET